MTRLQKMLSKIKTVDELADILGLSPIDIIKSIGISKDGDRLVNCERTDCNDCKGYEVKEFICASDSIQRYLNTELSENVKIDDHAPVIKMRDNARKLIKSVIINGFKQGYSAHTVYIHLDEYIDVLEAIGLFEENELRNYVSTDLVDLISTKGKENHK